MSARNSYVGNPINRIEDRRFLRGAGIYVGDLNGTDLTHAAIVRSPVAHGSLRGIDAAAARAMPGVIAVITAAEIGAVPRIPIRLAATEELKPFAQPVIADAKVRYVGEPVAIVVADTAGRAEDAARAVVVDVDPLPPVTGRAAARSSLLFESFGSNHAISYFATKGDADAAFRDAPYVRREKFAVHRHSAVTMEPRGLLARWDSAAGRMTLFGAAKVAWANRKMLAGALGLAEDAVELVENDVGGGFGVRGEFYPEDFLVPFAARFTGRPVKWVEDRRENLIASNHAREADCEIEIACARDGTILGLRGKVWNDIGAYMRTTGAIGPRNVAQFLSGAYRVPAIAVEALVMLSNKTPTGTYRGPGRFEADFFR
ncbi:MAG: xanthine dehydrogenase family protein molybdopterin-binding subunit, partial [Rhodospirillaceae bacterium]